MKRLIVTICSLVLVFGMFGLVGATPISFDLAGDGASSVVVTDTNTGWLVCGDISASLAGDLDDQVFSLEDGQSKIVDFFTLTVSGVSFLENYTVEATLGFDLPDINAAGSGGGTFSTFFGIISGGTLSWDPVTLPDFFTIGGDMILVDFEDGCAFGFGDTVMVHATIANMGTGVAPVPEPATLLLLGAGLAGLAAVGRRKAAKA